MRPVDLVRKLCPAARPNYLAAFERGDALFQQHGVTTPKRIAHFLAQVLHESGGLRIEWESGNYSAERMVEIFGVGKHSASVTREEAARLERNPRAIFERVYGLGNPRKAQELGNTQPGDGYKYRGGGLMQTTGRFNYRLMGERCGVPFEANPALVVSAEHALKPALAEWTKGNCNAYADKDDILSISRIINLGNPQSTRTPNGMADRRAWLAKVKPLAERTAPVGGVVAKGTTAGGIATGTGVAVDKMARKPAEQGGGIDWMLAIPIAVVGLSIAFVAWFVWPKKKD
jgi:putative chitinase